MKTKKLALTLAAAALMPALAFASTDEVVASFERDLQRNFTVGSVATVASALSDPLDIVNHILSREPDAVVASFDRSLYRQPVDSVVATAREADPLDAINVAFRYVESNSILASFQYGLFREGIHTVSLPITYDDPLRAINIALWQEMGDEPVVHLVANSY